MEGAAEAVVAALQWEAAGELPEKAVRVRPLEAARTDTGNSTAPDKVDRLETVEKAETARSQDMADTVGMVDGKTLRPNSWLDLARVAILSFHGHRPGDSLLYGCFPFSSRILFQSRFAPDSYALRFAHLQIRVPEQLLLDAIARPLCRSSREATATRGWRAPAAGASWQALFQQN